MKQLFAFISRRGMRFPRLVAPTLIALGFVPAGMTKADIDDPIIHRVGSIRQRLVESDVARASPASRAGARPRRVSQWNNWGNWRNW